MSAPKPPLVPVLAGSRCIGHLLSRGRLGFEAWDHAGQSLGLFETQAAATAAIAEAAENEADDVEQDKTS
jgi:hypothetical protein